MPDAPRLDGVHHVKVPVSDLSRSLDWYRTRLGYAIAVEFVEQGALMGYALRHPHGGPMLALRLDPARARASAGFDYFSFGVADEADLHELADRLTALGETHAGVHFATLGWILPGLRDPDGFELRFYTTAHHTEPDVAPIRIDDPRETAASRAKLAGYAGE